MKHRHWSRRRPADPGWVSERSETHGYAIYLFLFILPLAVQAHSVKYQHLQSSIEKDSAEMVFRLNEVNRNVWAADKIYHWVDENGVAHYSQQPPPEQVPDLKQLDLPDTGSSDYDPEEDLYGVQAQAERMSARRAEMEQNRANARERQTQEAQLQAIQKEQPEEGYMNRIWNRPAYPTRPIQRPKPPAVTVPRPPSSLKPSG